MLYNILLIVQIIVSAAMIVLILMQHGKGADAGAAFGSGASGTVFGSQGSANFLSRTTAILATVFFINCMALAMIVADISGGGDSVVNSLMPTEAAAPAEAGSAAQNSEVPAATNSEVPAAPAGSETPAAPAAASEVPAAGSETPAAPASEESSQQQ